MTDTVNAAATDIEFLSAYDQGFARVAAVTLPVVPVDPAANAAAIIEQARTLAEDVDVFGLVERKVMAVSSLSSMLLSCRLSITRFLLTHARPCCHRFQAAPRVRA